MQKLPWTPTSYKKFGGLAQIVANLYLTINWHKASVDPCKVTRAIRISLDLIVKCHKGDYRLTISQIMLLA